MDKPLILIIAEKSYRLRKLGFYETDVVIHHWLFNHGASKK
jgi:hypothetical protein